MTNSGAGAVHADGSAEAWSGRCSIDQWCGPSANVTTCCAITLACAGTAAGGAAAVGRADTGPVGNAAAITNRGGQRGARNRSLGTHATRADVKVHDGRG